MSKLVGKKQQLFGITLILLFFLSGITYPLPAEDVEIINDRDYFPRVHQLFQQANHNIYVIMFSAHYYDRYPNSPSNILLKDLAEARKRGLNVKVILEQGGSGSSGWFRRREIQPEQHQRVTQFLKQHGVPYTLDSPEVCTHAKLIIVDELYTIIGSTNWSYSAMTKNHETAVIIKSREVAKYYIKYFKQLGVNPNQQSSYKSSRSLWPFSLLRSFFQHAFGNLKV